MHLTRERQPGRPRPVPGRRLRPVFAIHTKGCPRGDPRARAAANPRGPCQRTVLNKFQFKSEGERATDEAGGGSEMDQGDGDIYRPPIPPYVTINELLIPPSECRTTRVSPYSRARRDTINPLCPDGLSPALSSRFWTLRAAPRRTPSTLSPLAPLLHPPVRSTRNIAHVTSVI